MRKVYKSINDQAIVIHRCPGGEATYPASPPTIDHRKRLGAAERNRDPARMPLAFPLPRNVFEAAIDPSPELRFACATQSLDRPITAAVDRPAR
jgi:hypothetical protein